MRKKKSEWYGIMKMALKKERKMYFCILFFISNLYLVFKRVGSSAIRNHIDK